MNIRMSMQLKMLSATCATSIKVRLGRKRRASFYICNMHSLCKPLLVVLYSSMKEPVAEFYCNTTPPPQSHLNSTWWIHMMDIIIFFKLFWSDRLSSQHVTDYIVTMLCTAPVAHRLTMLYLCNDIVQTCKRKHAVMYKDSFKDVLRDTALLVRYSLQT